MYRRFYKPRWTFVLIATCFIVFLIQPFIPFLKALTFIPTYAFSRPWTFITSIFLHGDFMHLFFNMFALFLFGIYLESRVGAKKFLFIFFSAGILGNFAYLITSFNSSVPAVGASGAIFGILGLLAILYPTLIVWFGYVPMPMIAAAIIWAITSVLGLFTPGNIAHEAHLAGLLIGALYGFYLRKKTKRARYFLERF
jgi:membrane associated rhomboid family serine protease